MWKKDEERVQISSQERPISSIEKLKERAIIGSSVRISGELTSGEDVIVQGQVEGKIDMNENVVTIGKNGRVKADVYAKIVSVEGQLEGNIFGKEKVVIRKSGSVQGNITAPCVNLEEGSKFKGSIDMESHVGQRRLDEAGEIYEKILLNESEKTKDSPQDKTASTRKTVAKKNQKLGLGGDSSTS